jgi:pimeloyl-ACP methyl ester carboxylesterase
LRSVRRRLISALALILGLLLALVIFVRLLERVSVYYPEPATDADRAALFGPRAEEIWLTTADGVRLNAVFAPADLPPQKAPAASSRPENNRSDAASSAPFVILYFHGNAGHLYHRADKARVFQDLGADVFIVDYRGYGRSEGKPSERGLYADAQAAYRYLTTQRAVPPQRIVAYGESLGGAPAIYLAARVPLAGVICEGCFTSAADMARTLIPGLPFEWLMAHKFPLLREVRQVRVPLLFFHARDDEVVPFAQGRRLFQTAKTVAPATFIALAGGHNDATILSRETYREALRTFFDSLTKTR